MNVLVLFEMSGRVREAFIKNGHYAISVDLQESLLPGNHLVSNVYDLDIEWIKTFDLIIAFPPCTYFSLAGNRWYVNNPDRYNKLNESIDLINWVWNLPVKYICMENPSTGRMKNYLPISQDIQPFWFGENYAKQTGLWLKNLPLLFPTDINMNYIKSWTQHRMGSGIKRSITPWGIANAMADQWNELY